MGKTEKNKAKSKKKDYSVATIVLAASAQS